MISVVIAEYQRLVREGIRAIIEAAPDIRVVGEAENGLDARQLVKWLRPLILLLDLSLPPTGDLEALEHITQETPSTRTIVLSGRADPAFVDEVFKNGAVGYLLKQSTSVELFEAVRRVAAGQKYMSPLIGPSSVRVRSRKAQAAAGDRFELLSARERVILQHVAKGLLNKEIAAQLSISKRTVEFHRANLMRKLRLRTQADLVRYAVARGLITLP